jgi:hypothetical protein
MTEKIAQYQVQGLTARGWVTALTTTDHAEALAEMNRLLTYGVQERAVRLVPLYAHDGPEWRQP